MSLAGRVALQHAERLLVDRAEQIRPRLQAEPGLWAEYCDVVRTLAEIAPATAPGSGGELLTTAELAAKIGVTPKTLLRRKAAGEIMPAVQRGKLLRWRAGQTL